MVQPVPEGYHSITPRLTLKDTKKALEFYKKALGAKGQARSKIRSVIPG